LTTAGHRESWDTASPDATLALGEAVGRSLLGGLVIGLVGPLGSGKTQLVKGIAVGNAVDNVRRVTSPTFTLVHEYPGRLVLYHVDAYRLSGAKELLALGFDELLRSDAAVVVEWADRVRPVMPDDTLWVGLAITGDTTRSLTFDAVGAAAVSCLKRLEATSR
jgi:tRNA threonylcarbamoyladenosine biosynthesis protein TsaE